MKLSIFINKMMRNTFTILTISIFIIHVIGDCISCNNCIVNNSPKKNNKYIIFPSTYNTCDIGPAHTHFDIKPLNGFNGCGYQQEINETYRKCIKQCNGCQKIDHKCTSFTDHPSSTIRCPLKPCIRKGQNIQHATECCPGLELLDFKCIDTKTDCTQCNGKVETGKPCCSTSGVNVNGVWRCASDRCNDSKDCGGGYCCISGVCRSKTRDKDSGQNESC
jgi:hypothetical protein